VPKPRLFLISDFSEFPLTPTANHLHIRPRPAPLRGALRNVTKRGAGCGGRGWCCRRRRLKRTEKSRGPDAPTLASSSPGSNFRGRRWQESPVAGEIAKEAVKTIARGIAGVIPV